METVASRGQGARSSWIAIGLALLVAGMVLAAGLVGLAHRSSSGDSAAVTTAAPAQVQGAGIGARNVSSRHLLEINGDGTGPAVSHFADLADRHALSQAAAGGSRGPRAW